MRCIGGHSQRLFLTPPVLTLDADLASGQLDVARASYSGVSDFRRYREILERGVVNMVPQTLSDDCKRFLVRCLTVLPNERPSAAELLCDRFLAPPPP